MKSDISGGLPTISVRRLLHWGSPRGPKLARRSSSLEGPLLSCSTSVEAHEAWHQIARLGGESQWTISRAEGFTLVDVHRLAPRQKRLILEKARDEGLLAAQSQIVWKLSCDSENDTGEVDRSFSLHYSKAEARSEIDSPDTRPRIHALRLPSATPPLNSYWHSRITSPRTQCRA